jgi:heptosyltransferase-2
MIDSYLEIAAAVGAPSVGRGYTLPISQDDEIAAARWFGQADLDTRKGPVVGINPGAHFGSSKTWVPSRFAAVAETLQKEHGASIFLLGGPGEEPLLNEISRQISGPHYNSAHAIVPLRTLAAVLRRMDLLITNDTGPRSVAQAVATPTVVIAGPMDTGWTAANLELSSVLQVDVDCGPCNRAICRTDHRCMTQIAVSDVVKASVEQFKDCCGPDG